MKLLILNIKDLIGTEQKPGNRVMGNKMDSIGHIENAFLLIENDRIKDFGKMADIDENYQNADYMINAQEKMVFPCWCDSHTHLVYAGNREQEFVMRVKGADYEEIAKAGGGILNSARLLNETEEIKLLEPAFHRLEEIKMYGTGAVEIKSGYALTLEGEIKMLRVAKKLQEYTDLTIKTTFLGAHAIPQKYKDRREDYIKLITDKMLPAVAEEELADYCDVFCDRGFFTPDETDTILKAGEKYGLKAKIHANELDYSGGIQIGVKNKAISVDHLEFTGEDEINALQKSDTIPTLLPSTAFFLNLEYPPARKMIESNLPVALATDFNPGSSPSGNMNFVLSLACIKMKMTPGEAINAATLNGAAAMELEKEMGSIAKGKKANVFITKKMDTIACIPYSFGSNMVDKVILNGKIQTKQEFKVEKLK